MFKQQNGEKKVMTISTKVKEKRYYSVLAEKL